MAKAFFYGLVAMTVAASGISKNVRNERRVPGEFTCDWVYGTEPFQVQDAVAEACDVSKPFTVVPHVALNSQSQYLYCCTAK